MFIIKHNCGLYLYPEPPKELTGFPELPNTLIFASPTQTKDAPKMFKNALDAWNFISNHKIGGMAKPRQIVKEKPISEDLEQMIWLVNDIEGMAIKVVPFRQMTNSVVETVISANDVLFEF